MNSTTEDCTRIDHTKILIFFLLEEPGIPMQMVMAVYLLGVIGTLLES